MGKLPLMVTTTAVSPRPDLVQGVFAFVNIAGWFPALYTLALRRSPRQSTHIIHVFTRWHKLADCFLIASDDDIKHTVTVMGINYSKSSLTTITVLIT